MVWETVLDLAISNGLWAALFVLLLIYQLRDSSAREKKYQNTINELSAHLKTVTEIKKDVSEIKKIINRSRKTHEKDKKNAKNV